MFAPDPLWGAGLPRPHVGGWGGGLLISIERARPTHVYKPAEALAIGGGGRGAAGQGASKQAVSDYVSQVLFQGAGSRRVTTARADASRLRTLRSMPLYWFFLGSGARVLGAAWGSADRRPGGATAPETATQAAAAARARPAPARCLVLGRCRSPAPYCGSMASSATWSACRAKVPGQDVLRTAIQGRGRVLRPRARAAALRRVRPPRRREGLFVCVR